MCIYVRDLTASEGLKIQRILRKSTNRTAIRRAQVILMSEQGYKAAEIAESTYLHVVYVRELIRRFNEEGLELLKEKKRPGAPVVFTEEITAEIIEHALSPPKLLGEPYTVWSLEKLRDYLVRTKVVKKISIEKLRTILKENNVNLQRTKTWKESNDPAFQSKKNA
jgi:transposase